MHDDDKKFNILADVAHELQTPIAIIMGNLELLECSDGEQRARAIRVIQGTLSGMSRLTNGILQAAALEGAKADFVMQTINIKELLMATREDCLTLAMSSNVSLEVVAEDFTMSGDRRRLREVLLNLISNALRYTPPGGKVLLCAHITRDVDIIVEDTGSGIAATDLPYIFERFYKIDRVGSRRTGIGLHLCRQIVEAHGGKINVESTPGKGSKFIISLPIRQGP